MPLKIKYIKNSFIFKFKPPLSKHESRRILSQSHTAPKHFMNCQRVKTSMYV